MRPALSTLPAALCLLLAGFLPAHVESSSSHRALQRYAVIIVLDGTRPDYFHLARMPNLQWLMRNGTVYQDAFAGQQVANTPPSHATIGTGVFPKHHGVMGFWWKDPTTDTVTRPTDTDQVQAGRLEAVISAHHAPSLAAKVKAADPRSRIVAVSGHKCYAADAMGTARADYILCSLIYHDRWVAQAMGVHRPPPGAINNPAFDVPIPSPHSGFAPALEQWKLGEENDWTTRYALWAMHRVHYPRVLMINLPETDVTGHFAVSPAKTEGTLMQHFDRELGQILQAYRAAGILGRTVFVVTADHGMSRVHSRLPFSLLDRAITLAHATKVFLEADTGAVIGIREVLKARAVAANAARLAGKSIDAALYRTRSGNGWTYRVASAQKSVPARLLQAYIDLADTSAADDGPDVVLDYAPHVTTGDRPVGRYHWLAGHLGPQWDEQHIPLVIAGAGVRKGTVSRYPARLVDIAPTVERILGLSPAGSDGHVLADSLTRPARGDRAAQRAEEPALASTIAALKQRSG